MFYTEFPENWYPNEKNRDDKYTQKKLLASRKEEFVPDPSFAIQGDSRVSPLEYFIA